MASKKKPAGLLFDEVLPQAQRTVRSLLSLDPQEDVPASQQALEMALGFVPGIGQAMALRDIERARRANDPAEAALAASSFIPFGRLAGLGKRAGPVMSELDVYHGSPHKFDEFDASKIGTGEGAQAYGHGIYLAESPAVAKGYRKDLSGFEQPFIQFGNTKIAGQNLSDIDLEAFKFLEKGKKDAGQFPHNTVYYAKLAAKDNPAVLARLEEMGRDVKFGHEKNLGHLYTADLPDEMVDRMLDYDLPINQQNPYVLAALDRAGINTQSTMKAGLMAQGQEGHLARFGIPGIKYMDEGSRGYVVDLFHKGKPYAQHEGVKHATLQSAQERIAQATAEGFEPRLGTRGTRNFVVFPGEEKKVKILKRE